MLGGFGRLVGRLFRSAPSRKIFRFWDGSTFHWVDPMEVHRALQEAGDWLGLIGSIRAASAFTADRLGPALAAQAGNTDAVLLELADMVRKSFGVSKVSTGKDGKPAGLADLECVELLTSFITWLTGLEEEHIPLLSRPSAASHSAGSQTTAASSLSTSPGNASSPASPNQ
jgi:hypothetical protein